MANVGFIVGLLYYQPMKTCLLLAILSMSLSPLSLAANASEEQEAIKLLEQAVSKTNIFELPFFQFKAAVQIDSAGKPLDGTYRLLWNGPGQWREEITFPGYTEVQVGGKGTVTIQRSTDFLPLRISQLHTALGFGSMVGGDQHSSLVQVGLTPKDKIKKTRSRRPHGEKLTCVDIENERGLSSEICVNDSTGTLVRGSSYDDSDFQAIGAKVFPRHLGFQEKGKTIANVNVNEFATSDQFPPNAFIPPTGVSAQPGCMNPKPPRMVKSVPPEYPFDAKQQRLQGTVVLDALIGTDGIPTVQKAVASPSASLEASSQKAVAAWRYEPATCDGKPVQVETDIQVNYALSF